MVYVYDMDDLKTSLSCALKTFIGYPCNVSYDYSKIIEYANVHINNVGCPFSSSTYKANTKEVEKDVLAWFANLWGISKDKIWGYITNGSTESNMEGLYVGRESAGGKPHIFFTSADSHYSLFKIARILKLNICVIKTHENGEMDYIDFENKLAENIDKYIIINANLGTTMKGAMDNTREIYRILRKHNKHHEYYLHMDGALTGFYLPFIEKDLFFKAHVHSISISGHKFCGIPFPCGIFMMEKHFLQYVTNSIEYIGSVDATISGSRNGHSAIYFKHIIDQKGLHGFKKDIDECIELAEYLEESIESSWRNQNSITVVLPRPSDKIIKKWQLATEKNISHVIVMPHVTKEKIDEFIKDYNDDISNNKFI